jgi:predicted metal-dependent phosphotriesterase family hydrolase
VLLLDGHNRYDSVDPLFKNAATLQELATAYRPGKITVLDLTSNEPGRRFPTLKSIARLFGSSR